MEKTFIDPMIHSKRMELINIFVFGVILGFVLAVVWAKWYLDGSGVLQRPLVMSSVVAAAFGLGYYMLKANRRALMDRTWLSMDETGLKSMTPEGLIEVSWPEVMDVRIGMKPSRTRTPDIMIRTERGSLGVFMRWVDKSGPIPEVRVLAPGSLFYYPGGQEVVITPGNSEMANAIRERLGPEKIKEGAIISL